MQMVKRFQISISENTVAQVAAADFADLAADRTTLQPGRSCSLADHPALQTQRSSGISTQSASFDSISTYPAIINTSHHTK